MGMLRPSGIPAFCIVPKEDTMPREIELFLNDGLEDDHDGAYLEWIDWGSPDNLAELLRRLQEAA
jgi:hypothetical protein